MIPPPRSALAVALLSIPYLCVVPAPLWAQTAPYPELDHVQGTLIQTAAAPVRPMVIDSNLDMWAVNTGLNTVERFNGFNPGPLDIRQVPWGPVSIAEWDDPSPAVGPELLIVCRNTWGLLRMDKATGAHKEFIPLPPEPSDIVVDGFNHRAFVSCTGADAVVQINLEVRDGQFHRRYDASTTGGELQLKSPCFLHLESNGRVRVAPLHSGNNTTVTGSAFNKTDKVIKLSDPLPDLTFRAHQLPDEDLFEIDPVPPLGAGSISVVATGSGTILFAHGRNPSDNRYWMLNTDAKNANPLAQSEPALNFDFVVNRVTRLGPQQITSLEPGAPNFTSANTVGQPFALAFHPNGRAFVAGLLTDNVTMLDESAVPPFDLVPLLEIDLPPGSIPRGLALAPGAPAFLAVYCWGTARVEVYQINHSAATATFFFGYALSHDPLHADEKEGRRTFFDGQLSARQNVSCASCHIDGGTDFLAWNLSGLPFDNKGPMVTQTLIGLERVSPFHWRGERTLEDFNELGFPGLLGHDALPADQFAKMKAWLFALKNPANPFQNRDRVVDGNAPSASFIAPTQTHVFESILPPDLSSLNSTHPLIWNSAANRPTFVLPAATGDNAVQGLDAFQNQLVFQDRWRCIQCHAFPIGTNNDITDDENQGPTVLPERIHFKNTPFHEIWRKKQPLVLVDSQEPSATAFIDVRTFLGSGVFHTGSVADVLRFTQPPADDTPAGRDFTLDVAPFMQQWDQGLAPAAHFAYWLDGSSTPAEITSELDNFLLPQASPSVNNPATPNCDIVVMQMPQGARKTWVINRALPFTTITRNDVLFVVDSDTIPDNRSLQSFISEAATVPSLVMGVPVGMAERFAVDFDMDRRKNRDESAATLFTVNPNPDSAQPVFTRLAAGFVSTNSARAFIETNEPTTLVVQYNEPGSSDVQTVTSPLLSRVHAVMLTNLRPSTSAPVPPDPLVLPETVRYDSVITATDASGNVRSVTIPNAITGTEPFSMPAVTGGNGSPIPQLLHEHILAEEPTVTVGLPNPAGNRLVTFHFTTVHKQGDGQQGAQNRVLVARAYRVPPGGDPIQLQVNGALVSAVNGTRFANKVTVVAPVGQRDLEGPGSLILNTTQTAADGSGTLKFRVAASAVLPGDTVRVNVEAIVEATGAVGLVQPCTLTFCSGATIPVPFNTALSQWDFPRTTEKNFRGEGVAP